MIQETNVRASFQPITNIPAGVLWMDILDALSSQQTISNFNPLANGYRPNIYWNFQFTVNIHMQISVCYAEDSVKVVKLFNVNRRRLLANSP